ncbi:MAG: hypothetical protein ABJC19_05675 [Gemmatimonadota bacterium]
MAKCVIVSGTRVCDDGLTKYRASGGRASKRFPKLTKSQLAKLRPIRAAIRKLGVDPAQTKLAMALAQAVLAASWGSTKAANSTDIEQSVKLLLLNEVGHLDGKFTLVAY